jgi:hypothetical protein
MRDQRFEIRLGGGLRKKLNELAADKQITISEVIRRLVIAEHKKRFGNSAAPIAAPVVSVPVVSPLEENPAQKAAALEELTPAFQIFLDRGMPLSELGLG